MYEIFEFVPKINFFQNFELENCLFLANLVAKNPTLWTFFPSKIINFSTKIQIDFLVSNLSNGIFEPEMDLWDTVQCNLLQVRSVKYWKLWQLKMLGRDTNSSFV